ncbi:MAG TPA: hypothetical protein VGC41_00225 [Kofleriaceae bacterium]
MRWLVILLIVSACIFGRKPHVPGDYEGSTQVTVVNSNLLPLCMFRLFTTKVDDDNWFGTNANMMEVPSGGTYVFHVKPGTYHVDGGWCVQRSLQSVAGTEEEHTIATIDGPTTISFGPNPPPRHGRDKLIVYTKVTVIYDPTIGGASEEAPAEPQTCGAPGARVDSPNDCCDVSRAHQNAGANGSKAGEPYWCD